MRIGFLHVDMKSIQADAAFRARCFSQSKSLVGTAAEVCLETVNWLNGEPYTFPLGPGVGFFHTFDGPLPLFFRGRIRIYLSNSARNDRQDLAIQFFDHGNAVFDVLYGIGPGRLTW